VRNRLRIMKKTQRKVHVKTKKPWRSNAPQGKSRNSRNLHLTVLHHEDLLWGCAGRIWRNTKQRSVRMEATDRWGREQRRRRLAMQPQLDVSATRVTRTARSDMVTAGWTDTSVSEVQRPKFKAPQRRSKLEAKSLLPGALGTSTVLRGNCGLHT